MAHSINIVGGAPAAAPYGDGGGPLMPIACSGVRNISWEVWEAKTPMIVEQTEYATDSVGVGRYRGGPGMDLVVRALRPMDLTVVTSARRFRRSLWPAARRAGATRSSSTPRDGRVTEYSKVTGTHLPAGSRIELRLSGGAGVGPAAERPTEAVLADVAAGYLSENRAREKYPHAFA